MVTNKYGEIEAVHKGDFVAVDFKCDGLTRGDTWIYYVEHDSNEEVRGTMTFIRINGHTIKGYKNRFQEFVSQVQSNNYDFIRDARRATDKEIRTAKNYMDID